jgi:hypothetical protein
MMDNKVESPFLWNSWIPLLTICIASFDLPESSLPNSKSERVGFCKRISNSFAVHSDANSFAIISSPFPSSTLTTSPKSLHRIAHSSNRRLRRRIHRAVCVLFYSILWMHIRLSHAKNVNKLSIQPNPQRCNGQGKSCAGKPHFAIFTHRDCCIIVR